MRKQGYQPEKIIAKHPEMEVLLSTGQSVAGFNGRNVMLQYPLLLHLPFVICGDIMFYIVNVVNPLVPPLRGK